MTPEHAFTSWLASYFDSFVALKRSCGAGYVTQRKLLLCFDRYVCAKAPQPTLQQETLFQYLASLERLTPRSRDNVAAVVWPAVAYASRHGASVEAPPARPPRSSRWWRQRQPRILTPEEIKNLLVAAGQLPPQSRLRPATITALIGLLYTTGVRISEALSLDIGDLDTKDQLLTVRKGKYGKCRCIPLHESTVNALVRYIEHPLRPLKMEVTDPIFVSGLNRRPDDSTMRKSILDACKIAGLPKPWPRPHDFRHTFAIRRVAGWYEQGRDVSVLLPVLSTYLGHVSVENTRSYLIANGQLLDHAATRLEQQAGFLLDEVLK